MESDGGKMVYLMGADNYDIWRDRMEDSLYMKRLHAPVFGKKPEKMSDDDWATEHKVTCGFIRSYCDQRILNDVNKEKKDAKALWDMLEATYANKSGNNKLYVSMRLFHLRYVDGTSVSNHVNEFQGLLDKLTSMGLKCDDELMGLSLLNSLPPSWENFRMSWTNSAPNGVVSLSYAKSGIMNEEMRRKTMGVSLPSSDALVTHDRGRGYGDGGSRDRGKSQSRRRDVKCFHCGEKGHIRRDCPKLKKERDDRDRKGKGHESDDRVATAYDDEEELVIVCHEGNKKMAHGDTSWLLDSGASRHVTPRRELFASYTPGNYGALKMGNGGMARVVGVGDVILETKSGGRLVLKDVRHAPGIGMNVISSGCLDEEGYVSTLGSGMWKLTRGSLVVAKIQKISSLYVLDAKVAKGMKIPKRVEGSSKPIHGGHKKVSLIAKVEKVWRPKCARHLAVKERRLSWAIDSSTGESVGGGRCLADPACS